ncbi:hypothetical protein DFH06DRAFT_1442676 [Mycena polygramma]|nr:hypothetical protein DFH06DRAFT_1442676 [Mycena polygramma]
MAPIFSTRAGHLAASSLQEIEGTDDSLFDDLFVADSFEPSKLSDWLNRRADVDSRSESEDSDGESVGSDGAESVDSIDSDDDFDNAQVTASQTTAASTSSISTPPPPSTSTATLTTSSPIPPVTASESSSTVPPFSAGQFRVNGDGFFYRKLSHQYWRYWQHDRHTFQSLQSLKFIRRSKSLDLCDGESIRRSRCRRNTPNVIAGVIVSIFFAIVLILVLGGSESIARGAPRCRSLLNLSTRRLRGLDSIIHPPLSSIIPKRVKTRHASPSMVSRPAPASWVEFPGGASMYGRDSA